MSNRIGRRAFLRRLGAGVAGGAVAPAVLEAEAEKLSTRPSVGTIADLPKRKLGRIGVEVPPLSLGTGTMGHALLGAGPFEAIVNAAIDAGIRYVDTAPLYDVAEERLAPVLAKRRREVFLVTKVWARTRDDALGSLEKSLKTLSVEHADLCHVHNAGQYTRDEAIGKGGVLEGLIEARKRGWIKYIGCSGHFRPERLIPVIETGQIDLVMAAMNFVDRHTYNFEEKVLPTARKHGCGIACMKVYGGVTGSWDGYRKRRPGRLAQDGPLRQDAVDYALSIPGVSTCVVGTKTPEELRLTIEAFRNYRPLEGARRSALWAKGAEMAKQWGPHFGPAA
jgi:aryl-alcohol dehydrogenase-like predicted oxidoreductase